MASTGNEGLYSKIFSSALKNSSIVIVRTDWNEDIVKELEAGARKIFQMEEIENVKTIVVPGAVEIPFTIKQHALHNKADAYIAFACVIKGGTPHFDYVCQSITRGIAELNLQLGVPVIYGVLTVLNKEQAWERLGGEHGHKGEEAAITTLKMIAVNRTLSKS